MDSDSDSFEDQELALYNSNENQKKAATTLNIDELTNKLQSVELSIENTETKLATIIPVAKLSNPNKSKVLTDKNEYRKSPLIFRKLSSKESTSNENSPRPKILPEKLFDVFRTPFKAPNPINDGFVTPQIPSVARSLTSSSKYKKSRASLENEFQSQKILFTTPKSAVRPLSSSLNQNNCSLDETLKVNTSLEQHERPLLNEERKKNVLELNGNTYVLQKKIGSGGSSTVFLATDTTSLKEYAIKVSFSFLLLNLLSSVLRKYCYIWLT